MNENRRKILEMLAQGQVSADEAERLIAALETTEPRPKPKYIRVVVVKDGKSPTNIRVPMQLLRAGVKLSSLMPAPAREHLNDFLSRGKGVPIDLSQIKPENLEELIDQLGDLSVDVNDKDVNVRIFCE